MPTPKPPYDPQPERSDALGEAARAGFDAVPGDHAARLASLRARLAEAPAEPSATVRQLDPSRASRRRAAPRRWLAVAAAAAILVVASLLYFNYEEPATQIAAAQSTEADEPTPSDARATQTYVEADAATATDNVGEALELERPPVATQAPTANVVSPTKPPAPEPMPAQAPAATSQQRSVSAEPAPTAREDWRVVQAAEVAPAPVVAATPDSAVAQVLEQSNASTESVAEVEADGPAAAADAAADADSARRYRLERGSAAPLLEISGQVVDPDGMPLVGAGVGPEGSGAVTRTDAYGEFKLALPPGAVVVEVSAEDLDTLRFDASEGDRFDIRMPSRTAMASIQREGQRAGLNIVAPSAPAFADFDAYASGQGSEFAGREVVVQFTVNRNGRPRQVLRGPGDQPRELVRAARALLLAGPDWPERYRRDTWRYTVRF